MATVYLVYHLRHQRPVALKVLPGRTAQAILARHVTDSVPSLCTVRSCGKSSPAWWESTQGCSQVARFRGRLRVYQ
jgi:hypothetical protein